MVGGIVVEVCDMPHAQGHPDRLYVDVVERPYPAAKKVEHCAICVVKNEHSERIQIGDALWWQCDHCYWTPQAVRNRDPEKRGQCGVDYDIPIPRASYSGVSHPLQVHTKAK